MLAKNVTQNVSAYLKEKQINIRGLSEKTGIPYGTLYSSVADRNRSRELRADELLSICCFLETDPMGFADITKS